MTTLLVALVDKNVAQPTGMHGVTRTICTSWPRASSSRHKLIVSPPRLTTMHEMITPMRRRWPARGRTMRPPRPLRRVGQFRSRRCAATAQRWPSAAPHRPEAHSDDSCVASAARGSRPRPTLSTLIVFACARSHWLHLEWCVRALLVAHGDSSKRGVRSAPAAAVSRASSLPRASAG